ncbi:MAG: AraC family transcriptional regulator [Bacteroidales bacterium]|nr:AraC family transcriptional regulator [Bacteroidales bacterium]
MPNRSRKGTYKYPQKALIIILPTLIAGFILNLYLSSIKDYTIFPLLSEKYEFVAYTDSSIGGNSTIINHLLTDTVIKLEFILKEGIPGPYIGISIGLKHKSNCKLKLYNELAIKMSAQRFNNVAIALWEPNPYTDDSLISENIVFHQNIFVKSVADYYHIKIDEFEVPTWWKELNSINNEIKVKPNLSKVTSINISNGYVPEKNKPISFEIYEIKLVRNNKGLLAGTIIFLALLSIISVVGFYVVDKFKREKVLIKYQPVEVKENYHDIEDKVLDFINNNFHDSNLSLKQISEALGVPERRITNIIYSKCNCNFRTYINRVRMAESKRLLSETKLSVSEIAFAVGFNSPTHFNRVFKSIEKTSPTEYRNKINR